jgi:1,4-alpha-glucan branching enzyme
VRVSCL